MSELRRNLQINGEVFQLAVSQYGDGAPQATTPGKPGVLYLNTFNGNLYKCTAADPDNDVYTWVPMVGAGSLFATSVKGAGAEEISVQTLKIHKPNVGYVLSIGDKLITPDNYLYEITALPADLTSGYTAKLVQQLGAAVRTKGVLIEASVAGNMAQTVSIPKSNLVMPDESYSPVGGDYVITTDNCLYRVTGIAVSSDSGEESYTCSLIRTVAGSLQGDRNPDNTTAGTPGQLYLNTINGNLYKCTAADPESGVYTWVAMVGAGGLFYTTVTSEGAEEISVQTLKIHKPNVGYVLSIGDKLITPDNYLYEITALPADLTSGYTAKLVQQLGGSLSPNAELFDKADLVDPAGRNSFITQDGVEYYRYNATAQSFEWVNPSPAVGAVTITARGVSQYGGTGGTRLLTVYDDGTYGPELYIVVGGESQTVTVTTDENKTLSKITGNYDMENWVLLDMSVMSVKAEYLVQEEYVLPVATADNLGGIKADPATDADTIPARIKNGRLFVAGATDAQIADAVNTYIEDNPISGGSKDLGNFRLIAQISTEEDISDYEITTDESGMAFALDEVIILIDDVTESNSPGFGYQSYFVNDMQLAGYVHNFVNKTKMFYMVKKGNRIYYEEMSATESVTADYSFAGINNRDYGAHGISRIIDAKICKINIKRMTCTTGNFTITMLGR